jgi:flavin-dependent dehydrogenase
VHFDAIVIGGGPSGSFCALLLARLGWGTALIERRRAGTSKACGHCLHPAGLKLLRAAGLLEGVCRVSSGLTLRARVHVPGREPLIALMGRSGSGLLVDRVRFDSLLVDRAATEGVRVYRPASGRVGRLDEGGAVVEVVEPRGGRSRRLSAGLIVGADGLRSDVAARAGLTRPRLAGRKIGFAVDLAIPVSAPPIASPGTIEMFVVPRRAQDRAPRHVGGYLGVVRHGRRTLHVAGLIDPRGRRAGGLPGFLRRAIALHPLLAHAGLDGALGAAARRGSGADRAAACLDPAGSIVGAGPMPWRPARVARGPVALVGDAAGFTEPFTGEGMSWALRSACLLASVAAESPPGEWTDRMSRRYERAWRRGVGRRQATSRRLATVLERPALLGAFVGAAGAFPGLRDRLLRAVVAP